MDILDFVEGTDSLLAVADTQDFVEGMDMDLVALHRIPHQVLAKLSSFGFVLARYFARGPDPPVSSGIAVHHTWVNA